MLANNYYYRNIISSKLFLENCYNFPKIKKITIFFIINTKYYKKNLVIFYILLNFCFSGHILFYIAELNNYQVLNFFLKKKEIYFFFKNFITFYLPTLELDQNNVKKIVVPCIKNNSKILYSLNYYNFPILPEFDYLFYINEQLYNIVNMYKTKINFYIKNYFFIKNSLECLLRIYRVPVEIKHIRI